MLEVLEFIFRDYMTFYGTVVLISVLGVVIKEILDSIFSNKASKNS